jgi:acyl transferase domain-containing protein
MDSQDNTASTGNMDIAIIGIAGRFPGANNIPEFWDNLKLGVEAIRFYSEEEVVASGVFPEMARDPDFVAAAGGIDHEFDFDADFFGFNPREAEITDPQQRIALECAWETLESAGYNPESCNARVGVYAGVSINTYFLFHLAANRALLDSIGHFQMMTANDKDFLATRISYKLNLKGPAMSVQTACSTSLVAVNLGCQSLLNYQSDMVLAGGVSITPKGRLYKESFIFSKDGHCRAFDENAQGTVGGNGVGFVLLKRLADAIADGDHICAVIKGSAINNDGSLKVGYTAPSVTGQVDVILEAQAMAGVDPDTITYVEAHGTGTLLGDPIEIAALTQAFRTKTERNQYCAIGSVKTNIGHLDTAAGISGFIKAALTVEHGQIPPSLNCEKVNPKLRIEQTPFFVNTQLRDWNPEGFPRRAAVSSFGFGGTNAHAILEQAPALERSADSRDAQILLVSGRNDGALKGNLARLGQYLTENPKANLADVAYTLQVGRKGFGHRAYIVARDAQDAAAALDKLDPKRIIQGAPRDAEPSVAFLFSGQGSQYINMGMDLYDSEPVFRAAIDEIADVMTEELAVDLRTVIYPAEGEQAKAEALLTQTQYTQPALFATEYALAKLWQSWGIEPRAMVGHSVGEYVAATLAGVFSLADAARLVCVRGRLVQAQPEGAMITVPLPESEVTPLLDARLSLAAVNAPGLCVVAGDHEAIAEVTRVLAARGVEAKRLIVSHAFHSHMLDNAARELEEVCATVEMNAPTKRYVSNVTGTWITDAQATSPRYWADHMRQAVRFSQCLGTILADKPTILLEVGPGQSLTTLARQHRDQLAGATLVTSTRHPLVTIDDVHHAMGAVGQLWIAGASFDWQAFHHHGQRRRVPLPTYAFQRKRYWLPPVERTASSEQISLAPETIDVHLESHEIAVSADYQAPVDDVERSIANVWEKALGISRISTRDDFFKLGGHSLLATQLIAEIRRVTSTEVAVAALFKDPTIAGLAEEVRKLRAADPDFKARVFPVISREGKLPLSYHQQMVWDFERKWGGSSRFNGCLALRLTGELDHDAMQFAIDEIYRRHEVLRTNYVYEDGESSAIVRPFTRIEAPRHDFTALPPAARERELLALANELARRPFDLTKDVYIRPILVKMTAKEHMLVIASHYVAVDGWTIGLVIQEFGSHYTAFKRPNAPRLPELAFQCVDYAAWQRQHVNDETIEAQMPYWTEQLADVAPQRPMPLDRMRGLKPTIKGSSYHFTLGRELTESVKAFSHEYGYTTFMTFVTALNALFHMQSGMEDIVIGTMTGDREIGTEALVGALVNMLALRTKLAGDQTFLQILENVRKTSTDAFAHQVPFTVMAEKMNRNLFLKPFFRTVFILRSVPSTETRAADLDIQLATVPLDRGVSDMDLSLYLQEKQGAFTGYFEYNTDLLKRATIQDLVAYFIGLLRDVIAQPNTPINQLLPLPEKRRASGNPMQRMMSMLGIVGPA